MCRTGLKAYKGQHQNVCLGIIHLLKKPKFLVLLYNHGY
jgi:hypothetical protein